VADSPPILQTRLYQGGRITGRPFWSLLAFTFLRDAQRESSSREGGGAGLQQLMYGGALVQIAVLHAVRGVLLHSVRPKPRLRSLWWPGDC